MLFMYGSNAPLVLRRRDACLLKQQARHITYPEKSENHPANRNSIIHLTVTLSHKKS